MPNKSRECEKTKQPQCAGIALVVTYASSPVSSEGRFDKFLAHIDEDDGRGAAAEELTQHADKAKQQGLRNMHVVAYVLNLETPWGRPGAPTNEATVQQNGRFNVRHIAMAARLTHGGRNSTFTLVRHHIYEARNMVPMTENEIRVGSYDWH